MKQIAFELLCQIFGLSLVSGMSYQHQQIDAISPLDTQLYHYDLQDQYQQKIALITNESKLDQTYDFSALLKENNNLYIFSSGKTVRAQSLIELHQLTKEVISIENLDILYGSMQSFLGIDNLNIQGVITKNNTWYFFNAPWQGKGENGVFIVTGENIIDDFNLHYKSIKLPKINSYPTQFTDVITAAEHVYFLANTSNISNQASMIGILDLKKLKVNKTLILNKSINFQSLAIKSFSPKKKTFLLSTPTLNTHNSTDIYELQIK